MGRLMSCTRWAGLPALWRHSSSLHPSPFLLSVRLCLQLPAGSGSVGSSIRLTDWRLMTPANREEAVCLRDYPPIEMLRRRPTASSSIVLHAAETVQLYLCSSRTQQSVGMRPIPVAKLSFYFLTCSPFRTFCVAATKLALLALE